MSAVALFRKPVVALGLALGACGLEAEPSLTPQGTEYPISSIALSHERLAANKRGDHVFPSIALGPSGGVVVWQAGNAAVVNGQDIGGSMLTAGGSSIGNAFRVNKAITSDQLAPKAQLLANDTVLYAWHSKVAGNFNIYTRLAKAKKGETGYGTNFPTLDVKADVYAKDMQMNPAIAALPDGGALVAWQSYGQDGSMWGVYARRMLPSGKFTATKEFQVNQFSAYNQRNPALTGLANGNVVAVWISERERTPQGVDVYARIYSPTATPLTDEFLVDSDLGECSTPSVAALNDGGFTVVWNQRDPSVKTNGYDIYGRAFAATGMPQGEAFRINTYRFGDQYEAKIASGPAGSMVVWTSLLQDGSKEGVFGRFLAGGIQPSGDEFRVNSTTAFPQMHPSVAWNGVDRFVAVWTSYVQGTGFDVFGQAYALNQ